MTILISTNNIMLKKVLFTDDNGRNVLISVSLV